MVVAEMKGDVRSTMSLKLLLGNEAVAKAAMDEGAVVHGYPGTPWTEAGSYFFRDKKEDWAPNEKVAAEWALGQSYSGTRTLVGAKHVGWNVAAELIMNVRMTGVHAGMVFFSADDPGMHSSQNEQDNRFYPLMAQIPCVEPWDQQSLYHWTRKAFSVSERMRSMVFLRSSTRLLHTRSLIQTMPPSPGFTLGVCERTNRWNVLPAYGRKVAQELAYRDLESELREHFSMEGIEVNPTMIGDNSHWGIISSGMGTGYLEEILDQSRPPVDWLKIGFYPCEEAVSRFLQGRSRVLVVEEGLPFLERTMIRRGNQAMEVAGKLDRTLPAYGELSPGLIREALDSFLMGKNPYNPPKEKNRILLQKSLEIPPRLPNLCDGCGHRDIGKALHDAIISLDPCREQTRVFGDIGCYSLLSLELGLFDTLIEMGASMGMAAGAARSGLKYPVAFLGDSTFLHSGLPILVSAVQTNTNMTVIVSDNSTTAMTGQQPVPMEIAIEDLVRGMGVSHVKVLKPLPGKHQENVDSIVEELSREGLSVIVAKRQCVQLRRAEKSKQNARILNSQSAASADPHLFSSPPEISPINLLIAGIGGQGVLSAAGILGRAYQSVEAQFPGSLHLKQAEIHGMSQRKGSVTAQFRAGAGTIGSGSIEMGSADALVGMDLSEAGRNLSILSENGWLIADRNVDSLKDWDSGLEFLELVREDSRTILVDSGRIARIAGSLQSQNMVFLGVLNQALQLFEPIVFQAAFFALFRTLKESSKKAGWRAFELGALYCAQYLRLREYGGTLGAYHVLSLLEPEDWERIHWEKAGKWKQEEWSFEDPEEIKNSILL